MNNGYVCDLNALTQEQRVRHAELARILRPKVKNFLELPNGYSAEFDVTLAEEISEFCELEILCCPFFRLDLSHFDNSTTLSITGTGEIKPFIRAEFGILTTEDTDA